MRRSAFPWAMALVVVAVLALAQRMPASAHAKQSLSAHSPAWIECQYTNEYDNNQVNSRGNPMTDDLGNQWVVYYDLTRDIHDGVPCDMRVVMRIFNPSPDGSWSGTAQVFADMNGSYISSSYGKVSGSGTYQYHFVWRGPWFGVYFGSFHIEIDEFNGSKVCSQCGRAITDFSL